MHTLRHLVVAASAATLIGTVMGVAISQTGADYDSGNDPLAAKRSQKIAVAIEPKTWHRCEKLPHAFENSAAGYHLCYPAGWGFLQTTERLPATSLDGVEAASVRLASPAAFPWKIGTLPLDAVAAGATIIEITVLPSFDPNPEDGNCTPDSRLASGARTCEVRIDPMVAEPYPSGSVLEILSIHELDGEVLVVRSHIKAGSAQRAQVLSILETIRPLGGGS